MSESIYTAEPIGSPYKKQRPSLAGLDESTFSALTPLPDNAMPASTKAMELLHGLNDHQTLGPGGRAMDEDEEL